MNRFATNGSGYIPGVVFGSTEGCLDILLIFFFFFLTNENDWDGNTKY